MKKAFTLIAALAVLATASFAQTTRRMTEKDVAGMTPAAMLKSSLNKKVAKTIATSGAKNIASFPWTENFESGNAAGFTFVDSDGDGYGWDVYDFGTTGQGHNGSNMVITSASYINDIGALTPDNWMMLPAFDIPSDASDFVLSWYEKGQDNSYYAEYYSVYISTTGNTVADFTNAVLTSTATNGWVKKTVSLDSYAGQTIYIAFRHHNVTDMFYLDIDDMRVGGPEPPEVSITAPAVVLVNEPATFVANSTVNTVTWYVDGSQESETGLSLTYTFTTDGSHTVVVEASNVAGSSYDTVYVTVYDCGGAINEFPYTEGFEDMNPCWQFVSADAANDENVGITSEESHAGVGSFAFSSYNNAEDYNQFLISPEISLSGDDDYMVTFWYKGYQSADAFRVKVSSTTADTAAFTTVLGDYATVNTDWTKVAFALPANTKYIAINYYGDYAYFLYVDDLTIDLMGAPMVSLYGPATSGTGMEATFSADVCLADTLVWYVDGNEETGNGNTLSYIFTTVGNHEVYAVASNAHGDASDTLVVDVFSCDDITIPYTPDFSEGLHCWVNRSDSTEGTGWFASVDMFENDPEGQVLSMSAQSIWGMFMIDMPVDNWLTSPAIAMPASGSYEVAWKVKPYTTDYAGDHYGVYAIQGSNATLLFEETLNSNMTDYVQRTAAIPTNITGDFNIAFRHFNSVGGYVIILDNIQLRNLTAPTVTVDGPTYAEAGEQVTFTATSGTATSYAWTVDGTAVSANGNVLTHTFTTAGNHTVAVTANNAAGSSAPVSITIQVIDCSITSLPYNQGFEDATANCWSFGEGFYFINDPQYAQYANSGNGFIYGIYDENADCDQWAISPAITMPANATGIVFGYHVLLSEYEGVLNEYEVRVSTTGTSISNFTNVICHENGSTDAYEYRGVSLESFAGQTIYIALHNITPAGGNNIFFDDITIGQGQATGIDGVEQANISIYPNPVSNVLNVEGNGIQQVEVMDLNGRTIMTSAATSLNIENLASGMYLVRVIANDGIRVEKIVKE